MDPAVLQGLGQLVLVVLAVRQAPLALEPLALLALADQQDLAVQAHQAQAGLQEQAQLARVALVDPAGQQA